MNIKSLVFTLLIPSRCHREHQLGDWQNMSDFSNTSDVYRQPSPNCVATRKNNIGKTTSFTRILLYMVLPKFQQNLSSSFNDEEWGRNRHDDLTVILCTLCKELTRKTNFDDSNMAVVQTLTVALLWSQLLDCELWKSKTYVKIIFDISTLMIWRLLKI
jgi:hypothetical protein